MVTECLGAEVPDLGWYGLGLEQRVINHAREFASAEIHNPVIISEEDFLFCSGDQSTLT
jgi:hypothetical protein